jgi:hypothetical protein
MQCAFQTFVMEEGGSEKLHDFLHTGGVKTETWAADALGQLEKELLKGEASLHLDGEGSAVRVVSVAKPVIYDPSDHTVLIEAFQSFGPSRTKVKCSGMSEKFNPLEESCQDACARAMAEELKLTVEATEFCENNQVVKTLAPSQKFAGLKSEYHLFYCMLSQHSCRGLQAKVPKMMMTGVDETDSTTNPKTLWWAWCPSLSTREVERHLARLNESTPFAGRVDFAAELKLGTPGQQVREEAQMGKWWTAPAPQWQRDLLFKPDGAVSASSGAKALPEGTTPRSRRLSDCRTTMSRGAIMVESAPEPSVGDAGTGQRHRLSGSHRLVRTTDSQSVPLKRSSRHAAVWSLRTLDDDRGPLLSPKGMQGSLVDSSLVLGTSDLGNGMRRMQSAPQPAPAPIMCCSTGC